MFPAPSRSTLLRTTLSFAILTTGAVSSAPARAQSSLERVQGVAYEGYERTIDVHVKNLRKKIEPDPSHPRYVETVMGVGYRLAKR